LSLVAIKRRAEAVKYEGETFERLDLRSMKGFGSSFKSCLFQECQFDLADLRTAKFVDCSFHRCSMKLVNFSLASFEDSSFISCDLEQASFMGGYFRAVLFSECRLCYGETMFQDATVKGRLEFSDSNLHGSSLDFREVEPGALKVMGCNLWSAKVSLGCAFWNGMFDDRSTRQFIALIARVSQDPRLMEYAGDQYGVVCRAMDGRKGPLPAPVPVLQSMEMED
jgi:uncharacterized protein YjbI with pentapeptide repeats